MMKRELLFSFFVSLLSLVLVFIIPVEVLVVEPVNLYSPYQEEIEKFSGKRATGMTPSESAYLDELLEKNNQWFNEQNNRHLTKKVPADLKDVWKKKSDIASPFVMILWGISFYFFHRKIVSDKKIVFYVLTFPVTFLILKLMSILEVILILVAILSIWFWGEIKKLKHEKSN